MSARRRNEHDCTVFSPKPGGDTEGVEHWSFSTSSTFCDAVKIGGDTAVENLLYIPH